MLYELKNVRQIKNDFYRRCFVDDYFDLYIWFTNEKEIEGFQLCYEKMKYERALTWRRGKGYTHQKVDNGEVTGNFKKTPILLMDGSFNTKEIAEKFRTDAANIPKEISDFIVEKIEKYK